MIHKRTSKRGPRQPGATPTLTTADFVRARTWLTGVAEALLVDPDWKLVGDEREYAHGLHINMSGKGWYDHAAGAGSGSALDLVSHLLERFKRPSTFRDAAQWLATFLAGTPGTGPCGVGGGGDDDDFTPASAADCQDLLDRLVDKAGTATEVYLKSRGIDGPYAVDLLGHVEDARVGESAFIAKLTGNDRITGTMAVNLAPPGRKSLIEPVKQRF